MISIIIPCFNQGQFLDECIDSILNQTFQDFEIIIIDDGSVDNSKTFIEKQKEKDSKIRVIYNERNMGVSASRNKAIRESIGEFIFPLDADDKIAERCLEILYDEIMKGKADIISPRTAHFGLTKNVVPQQDCRLYLLLYGNMIQCSALFKKEHWKEVGGYDENMRLGYEDWDFWINMGKHNHGVYQVPEILFFYRIKKISRNTEAIKHHSDIVAYIRRKYAHLYNTVTDGSINKGVVNVIQSNNFERYIKRR